MELLEPIERAEIHRDVYAAIIKGWTSNKGERQALAARARITPEYLSMLLVVDMDEGAGVITRRTASPQVAHRISQSLRAPESHRRQLLHHMLAARGEEQSYSRSIQMEPHRVPHLIREIRIRHQCATQETDPVAARRSYHTVVQSGTLIARQISVRDNPLAYIELCHCLFETLCILDNSAAALMYARYAQHVLAWMDPAVARSTGSRVQDLHAEVLRGMGVAYSSLGLPRPALQHLDLLHSTPAYSINPSAWIASESQCRLDAIAQLSRFTLSEVEGIAFTATEALECAAHDPEALVIRALLGQCYLAYGSTRDYASPLLECVLSDALRSTTLNPAQRTVIYRTYASLCKQRGDRNGMIRWAHEALDLAAASGLIHHERKIKEALGISHANGHHLNWTHATSINID